MMIMRKKFFTWTNTALALMITSLGFGACRWGATSASDSLKDSIDKMQEPVDVYGPPPELDPEPTDEAEADTTGL